MYENSQENWKMEAPYIHLTKKYMCRVPRASIIIVRFTNACFCQDQFLLNLSVSYNDYIIFCGTK